MKVLGMEPEKGRWGLVLLGLVINLCLGTIYSWSVFVTPLTNYFVSIGQQVTANDVLLPFSVFLAFFAIAMPLTGRFIESHGPRLYSEARFSPEDYLVFGRETAGLPRRLLDEHADHWLRIPMFNARARSLNLPNCVALVLYEGLRQ